MASLIVAGATGAIGRTVVQHAIQQSSIHRVVALTRSASVTAANYEKLFGVVTKTDGDVSTKDTPELVYVTAEQAAKIHPVTIDWEAFTQFWSAVNGTAALRATSKARKDAVATVTTVDAETLQKYKDVFSGHTYAAMCLGTIRKDAGSAAQFTRCDYDYAIAFTEALLRFSAPAGLAAQKDFIHHLNDGGEVKKWTEPPVQHDEEVATTGTLRVISHISSARADSGSWFLYLKTKGDAEEAAVERVHRHNKLSTADGTLAPVLLLLLRPGLLQRHSKSRFNEKVAHFLMSSIPVETCGAAAVSACVTLALFKKDAPSMEAAAAAAAAATSTTEEGKPPLLGKPFTATKLMKKEGVSGEEAYPYVYELGNQAIKDLAARLPQHAPAAGATPAK